MTSFLEVLAKPARQIASPLPPDKKDKDIVGYSRVCGNQNPPSYTK